MRVGNNKLIKETKEANINDEIGPKSSELIYNVKFNKAKYNPTTNPKANTLDKKRLKYLRHLFQKFEISY